MNMIDDIEYAPIGYSELDQELTRIIRDGKGPKGEPISDHTRAMAINTLVELRKFTYQIDKGKKWQPAEEIPMGSANDAGYMYVDMIPARPLKMS